MEDLGIANVGWHLENAVKFDPRYFINAYLKSDKSTEELITFPSKINGYWTINVGPSPLPSTSNDINFIVLAELTKYPDGAIDTSLCLKFANKISDSRFKVIKENERKIIEVSDKQSIGVVCTGVFNDIINKLDEEEIYEGTYLDEITTIKHQKSTLLVYLFDVF